MAIPQRIYTFPDGRTRTITDAVLDRLFAKVDKVPGGCWTQQGSLTYAGYGYISFGDRQVRSHRLTYVAYRGPIPDGLVLDHLCRNRACVNPDHLEVVTNTVNIRRGESPIPANGRKTHCAKGHEYTAENTRYRKNGGRACRECGRERERELSRKKLEQGGRGASRDRQSCPQGHPYDAVREKDNARICTQCIKARAQRYREENREKIRERYARRVAAKRAAQQEQKP